MNKDSKKTLVINLMGAPGAGKSTTMADVFAQLKLKNVDCEMVNEFAKQLVWEDRQETFKDEIYIFAKQNHALIRVAGKIDVIVTDRPLILTELYNQNNSPLNDLVFSEFQKYENRNFFIERTKPYNPNGRNQTESESDRLSIQLKSILQKRDIPFETVSSGHDTAVYIANKIYDELISRGHNAEKSISSRIEDASKAAAMHNSIRQCSFRVDDHERM